MRVSDLALQRDFGSSVRMPVAATSRQRGPLADAVGRENGRATRRRRQERSRGVGEVMVGEQDLRPRNVEM